MIDIKGLSYNLNGSELIRGINSKFSIGEIIGIIGKSGSGKTVLLKLLSGTIKQFHGEILIDNTPLRSFSKRELNRTISYMSAKIPGNIDETVYDFILLSRIPYKKIFNPFSDYDIQIVEDNIKLFELEEYRDKILAVLPDCILKKTILAFLLSRNAGIVLLDNPTSGLDIRSISLLHKAIFRYTIDGNNITIISSNDLNFIMQTCDRVLILKDGILAIEENPRDIDIEIIKEYLNMDVFISKNIYNGKPNIHFFPEN